MKGTYALVIDVIEKSKVQIGALGRTKFDEGSYAYIGSALNGLESRVNRHLGRDKKNHWHIDYLLQQFEVEQVIFGECKERKECEIAKKMSKNFRSVEKFGSSDCDCGSHLFHSKDRTELIRRIKSSFQKANMEPREWENGK